MRKLLACFATSLILFVTPAFSQDRIAVASMNGETIWLDEILAVAETLPPEYQQAGLAGLYEQLVGEVANARLAAAAGRAAGMADEDRIAEAMQGAANRVLGDAYISRQVEAEITDEAIANAYDTFAADTASREQVTAAHILVETEEEANTIIKQLNNGADFAELAKEKSTGPSGPKGGELGSFSRGQMVPAFEAAAFGMPEGSYSATPVQTQFGWHVIRLNETRETTPPSLAEMRDGIIAELRNNALQAHLDALNDAADIVIAGDAVPETALSKCGCCFFPRA